MKKLALALVCLVSVAFFASCDPDPVIENPEPAISILETDGYLQNGDIIEMYYVYDYGFRCASNAETQANLAKFVVTCNGSLLCDTVISGTEFVYEGELYFDDSEKDFVGDAEIIATVTDVDGKSNKATIKVSVYKSDELEVYPFEWKREGSHDGVGLDGFGLKWTWNSKESFAVIEPLDDATLYIIPSEKWSEVVTESDLEALFSDGGVANQTNKYMGVSAWASHTYDDVIGTFYGGYYYLIHITKATVTSKGTNITIEGEYK